MDKSRTVEVGECPHCNSMNYKRNMKTLEDDFVIFDCSCQSCGGEFSEIFVLKLQNWKEDKDGNK